MEARISLVGDRPDSDLESLWGWLRAEEDLRGQLRVTISAGSVDAMGAETELVTMLVTSGTIGILVRSLTAWLTERERQRRADVTVEVTIPSGQKICLSAHRVADVDEILRQVLEPVEDGGRDDG